MEKKLKMTTLNAEFASRVSATINTWIEPFAEYVFNNKEELNNLTKDEIKEKLNSVLDLPKTNVNNGLSNMAPSLSNVSKEPKKRATAVKTEEACVWSNIEEYKKKDEEGEFLCAYYSKKLTDHRKEKVCCAPAIDTTDPDHKTWRCSTHKGKTSNIATALNPKGSSQGIDKTQQLPGLNLPSNIPFGMPPLPGMGPIGGIPPMPLMPPMPPKLNTTPLKLKVSTPPKQPEPVLPPLPVSEEKVVAPVPVVVKKQANINWVSNSNNTHLFSKDEELKYMLFEFLKDTNTVVIIGKLSYETSETLQSNYLNDVSPLSNAEKSMIADVFSLTYKEYVKPSIPVIPGLPPLPPL